LELSEAYIPSWFRQRDINYEACIPVMVRTLNQKGILCVIPFVILVITKMLSVCIIELFKKLIIKTKEEG
jgi:hypothetical protein